MMLSAARDALRRLTRTTARFARDEDGTVLAYIPFLLTGLVGLSAIAEVALMQTVHAQLQFAADSAALAAVDVVPDADAAASRAEHYASLNMSADPHGVVVPAANVTIGDWDASAKTFTPDAGGRAVRVVAERSQANGNALPLRFLALFGDRFAELSATAIAARIPDPCLSNGLVARGRIRLASHNTIHDGVCLHSEDLLKMAAHNEVASGAQIYGEAGVQLASHNLFRSGAQVVMPDLADLSASANNTGLDAALVEEERDSAETVDVDAVIDSIEAGTFPMPDFLDGSVRHVTELPSNPVPGRTYIIDGGVSLSADESLDEIAIIATGDIHLAARGRLTQLVAVTDGNIHFAASGEVGDRFCDGGAPVLLAARGSVSFAARPALSGAQILAGGDVRFTSHASLEAVSILAEQELRFSSHNDLRSCEDGASPALVSGGRTRLVY